MMRITSQMKEEIVTLKIEGGLTSRWIEELESCWRAASDLKNVQRVRLDLSEVTFVDDEAKEFLALIHQAGAEISATNVLTEFIAEEIAGLKDKTAL